MTDKIPDALAVLDELDDTLALYCFQRLRVDATKARAAFAAAIDALWVSTEHNALYYGESHNTVIAGRKALATVDKLP